MMTAFRWQWLLPFLLLWSCHGQGNELAGGRFTTTTDVTRWMNLAKDAADMRESDNVEEKKDIYANGRHANYTENGVGMTLSFASLSLQSYPPMAEDAMYNIYRHAFLELGVTLEGEAIGTFDEKPVQEYANTLVEDLFALNVEHIETEAALITCLWMAIVHELYEILRGCQQKDTNVMNAALDRAAAMWIGADQPMGVSDQGSLLYNLAQGVALRFNQATNGEAMANTLLLDAMLGLQKNITDGICITGEDGYLHMRTIVNRMIDVMCIPLVQIWIHRIQQPQVAGAPDFIELYALSIAPRVAACDPDTYQNILDLMVTNDLREEDKSVAMDEVWWSLSCLRLTCEDIGSYESGEVAACTTILYLPGDSYAEYVPAAETEVWQYSFIDRDILQIRILARMRALSAALDYYKHGMNVKLDGSNGDEFLSLEFLATDTSRAAASDQFGLYKAYFGSDNYADEKIISILTSVTPYDDEVSDPQRAELVAGYLTDMVMYMAVLQKLKEAINACDITQTNTDKSLTLLDQAAAFYVGSIEGDEPGGSSMDGGQLLYATTKALCGNFSKCVEEDVSEVNQKILAAFDDTSESLVLGRCDEAKTILETTIEPLLVVPLIQGALNSAVVNADLAQGSDAASLGTADPFAFALVPFFNSVDSTLGASLLTNLEFNPDQKPVSSGAEAVFEIFRTSILSLNLEPECGDVGQHPVFGSVCVDGAATPTYAPVVSSNSTPTDQNPSSPTTSSAPTAPSAPTPAAAPTAVGFGRYTFKSDSDISMAGLALDVKAMRSASTVAEATDVYSKGANVPGGETGTISLASLSLNAATAMKEDIDFNLFRFALGSDEEFGDGSYVNASTYADLAVMRAFVVGDNELAAEAAVVLNVWMQIASELQAAVTLCLAGGNAVAAVDKAAAIWLGTSQTEGSDDNGYLVYSITEKAATRFGAEKASESWVNAALFDAFNEAQDIASKCAATPDTFLDLRGVVADTIQALATPLLQNLLYYISKAEKSSQDYTEMENYVELYALSVVPRLIGCNPSSFFYLQTKLIDADFDTSVIDDELISHMQTLQKCYDLECEDLEVNDIPDANLKAMVQKLCYKQVADRRNIAGYSPATDVSEYLKLDLDIVQIGILAQTEAFVAATDMYVNGYNSRLESNNALSLRSLATSQKRFMVTDQFSLFSSYYGSDSFADDEIMAALQKKGVYATASVEQRREAVIRMLQCMVSYMTLLTNLYSAVDECNAGRVADATTFWDQAVALFVGSIEGEIRGGDPNGYGELLYSLGKEFCDEFGTCEASLDASSNEALLDSFSDGFDLIAEKQCDSAQRYIKSEILPLLPISLIQGVLYYSTVMEELPVATTEADLATGYVLSRAILPLVNETNSTSADIINSNMGFQFTADPVSAGSPAIFTAITYALPGMNVDCRRVGSFGLSLDNRTVCSDDLAPHSSTPTEMGDGLYTTTTYVQDRANIALDVSAIKNALGDGSVDLAKAIYVDGENSDIYNENGIKIGKRTLSGFSTKAPTEMADDPLYNIFRYGLQDEQGLFLGKDVGLYADTLVNEAFENTNAASQLLGAEAVVVYNVWMYLVHELFQTLRNCKNKSIADMDGIHSIDEAVAYWIGDGQVTGDGEQGHLLYALAEQMGERFGLDETGESRTNTNILRLFNQAKLELSLPSACSDDPETHPRLFQIVNKIVSWMTVPLVQGLIHNLYENDKDRVKLYGRAVWPLVAGCSNSTFTALKDKLFNADYNAIEVDDIVARIETTYECLGFTCEDIGVHQMTKQTCTEISVLNPLAGYIPQSDIRAFALIDLDILQSNILMKMGAYGAVEDLYTNGKHAVVEDESGRQTLSLYQLATTSQRSVVPQFDSFKRYYNDDERYADTIIRDALANKEAIKEASAEQRREMVVKGMQYLVLYMAAAQQMYLSVADCSSPDAAKILDAEEAWDRAAAYLIGSAEGSEDGGSLEGQSFYALARKRCEQFGTCSETGKASWNDELTSLLYTGRGAVESRACGELRRTTTEIEILMLIPLIQSTLRYANANAQLDKGTEDKGLAEGFVFSRSVLPLVEDANRDAAETIKENMDFQFVKKPVHEGPATVWNAFARAYGHMGVECELVGATESFDACAGATSPSEVDENDDNLAMILGIVLGVLAFLAIVAFLYFFDKKKKQKMLAENRPSFVPPKGELNHTPDQLTGSAYIAGEPEYALEDDDYNDAPESPFHDPQPSASNNRPESPLGGTTVDTSQDTSQDSSYTID